MSEQTSVSQVAGKSNFWESADIEPVRNVKIRKGRSNQSRSDRSSCVVQFKGRQSQRQRQPSLTTKSWMELENRAPVIALSANRDPAGILLSHPILSYPIPPALPLIPRYLSLCATTTTKLKSKSKPNTGLSHLKAASRSKERSERKRENERKFEIQVPPSIPKAAIARLSNSHHQKFSCLWSHTGLHPSIIARRHATLHMHHSTPIQSILSIPAVKPCKALQSPAKPVPSK